MAKQKTDWLEEMQYTRVGKHPQPYIENPTLESRDRMKMIMDSIRKGWSKNRIYEHYCELWNIDRQMCYKYLHDVLIKLSDQYEKKADEVVNVQLERIENIIEESLKSGDRKTALSAIDLENKLHSLYVEKQEIKADITNWDFKYNEQ